MFKPDSTGKGLFGGPSALIARTAPAADDLPGISTVALSAFDGSPSDASDVSGRLGEFLTSSSRYNVVERERLQAIASERGCAAGQYSCLAGVMPAAAVIVGSVSPAQYGENTTRSTYECQQNDKKAMCATVTRIGTAHASASLRLIDVATGKILAQRVMNEREEARTVGSDTDTPDPIDSVPLLDEVKRRVALDFYRSISPHEVLEQVALESDRDLPELALGNEHLDHRQPNEARVAYEAAVEHATKDPQISSTERGRAHYSLGLALAIQGEYDRALQQLQEALKLSDSSTWRDMEMRVRSWQRDASRVAQQLTHSPSAQLASVSTTAAASAAVDSSTVNKVP